MAKRDSVLAQPASVAMIMVMLLLVVSCFWLVWGVSKEEKAEQKNIDASLACIVSEREEYSETISTPETLEKMSAVFDSYSEQLKLDNAFDDTSRLEDNMLWFSSQDFCSSLSFDLNKTLATEENR